MSELRPAFKLDGDQALDKVLPITSFFQEQVLDSLGASLRLNLPTSVTTRTESVAKANDEARTTDSKTVERKEVAGEVADPPQLGPETRKASDLPDLLKLKDLAGELSNDPQVEYQTALALFQEVKLLNRYVDAATGRHGFEPYLVRLQIGVTPYAHRQPFDVYTQLGFFNGVDPEKACGSAKPVEDLTAEKRTSAVMCWKLATRTPEVVPLVVTDDLEITRQSRAAEVVRQLQAALAGTLGNVGASGQLQALNDQLQSVVGNSLNSLSSVTRLNDNTVQARFGAANDPSIGNCWQTWLGRWCGDEDRSMVNRNYFVSLLVLVPQPMVLESRRGALRLMSKTDLRRITDGKPLLPDLDTLQRKVRSTLRIYDDYLPAELESGSEVWTTENSVKLLGAVLSGDYEDFKTYLHNDVYNGAASPASPGTVKMPTDMEKMVTAALWTDLASLASSFDLHMANIDLPVYGEVRLPSRQVALVRDDRARGVATVRLQDGAELQAERLLARLDVTTRTALPGLEVPKNLYPIPADEVAPDKTGRGVLLAFPSLATLGVLPSNIERLDVVLNRQGDPRFDTYARAGEVRQVNGIHGGDPGDTSYTRGQAAITAFPINVAADARRQDACKSPAGYAASGCGEPPADVYRCGVGDSSCYYAAAYRPVAAASTDAAFTLRPVVDRVLLQGGEGEGVVKLIVAFPDTGEGQKPVAVELMVGNAELLDAIGGEAIGKDPERNVVVVTGKAGDERRVTVKLGSLAPDVEVTFTATGKREGVAVIAPATNNPLKLKAVAPAPGAKIAEVK